ncbi:dihydropteroate synthase [Maritalea porphyrae]|uniref:dihydropteroate synthase n=1 Tax=Maritalea porphyrae TaxID=880732 RepID=UPI0022AEB3C7|nr:dihydropteroate synthase [Maritalea porphyrae]MCZ4272884.1 dihydropteroate synthase [Maritalea porphyrae]
MHKAFSLKMGDKTLELGPKPLVMGILNVTPDSFSDGGEHSAAADAVGQAKQMISEGADIIDVGGESTRPGAKEVGAQAELDRIMPVLDALAEARINKPVSIDTYKAIVGHQAIQAGASIINDVWGFQRDPELADVAAHYNIPSILMHWDEDRDTQKDIVSELKRYFDKSIQIAEYAGLSKSQIVLDPGFGFAKTYEENFTLLGRIDELVELGYPILIGFSRKSTLGKLLGVEPKERVAATGATTVLAYTQGAHIFRVHDVRENYDALQVAHATYYSPPPAREI